MKAYHRIEGSRLLPGMILTLVLAAAAAAAAGPEQPVPVVDGCLGGCSAEFTVRDAGGLPLYDAKIDVSLRYGFLGLRRMSLQVGTNSDGRARVAGLPDSPGKTFRFVVTSGALEKAVLMNTSDGCSAVFDVSLGGE